MSHQKEFIEKIKDLSGNVLRDAIKSEKRKQVIDLVCRQTDYTPEKAEAELIKHKGNYMLVVKEYLNPTFIEDKKREIENQNVKSTNQRIYSEIRGFMDTAARNYEKKKQMQEFIDKKKEELLAKQNEENKKLEVTEVTTTKESKDE